MSNRGFTVVELLVTMGMLLTVSALIWQGVRPQVRNAGTQIRMAEMQQGSRSAFDLFARDMRMAGYGVDLGMPGVPSPVAFENGNELVLWGNFRNIKTTGSGAGSTVTVGSTGGFVANNYLVIRGFTGGEASRITGVGTNTVTLATPLRRVYASGSEVHQIESVRYQLSSPTALRDGQPVLDGVQDFSVQFILDGGAVVGDPAGSEAAVRSALASFSTQTVDQPYGSTSERMNLTSEVRIRNLGLLRVVN
jgi:Tfp pilus assembly protein PilW